MSFRELLKSKCILIESILRSNGNETEKSLLLLRDLSLYFAKCFHLKYILNSTMVEMTKKHTYEKAISTIYCFILNQQFFSRAKKHLQDL